MRPVNNAWLYDLDPTQNVMSYFSYGLRGMARLPGQLWRWNFPDLPRAAVMILARKGYCSRLKRARNNTTLPDGSAWIQVPLVLQRVSCSRVSLFELVRVVKSSAGPFRPRVPSGWRRGR